MRYGVYDGVVDSRCFGDHSRNRVHIRRQHVGVPGGEAGEMRAGTDVGKTKKNETRLSEKGTGVLIYRINLETQLISLSMLESCYYPINSALELKFALQ